MAIDVGSMKIEQSRAGELITVFNFQDVIGKASSVKTHFSPGNLISSSFTIGSHFLIMNRSSKCRSHRT